MEFNRFDICEGWYVYATLWAGDRTAGETMRRLRALGFRPGQTRDAGTLGSLTANGRAAYTAAVRRFQPTESGYVPCACCGSDTIGTLVLGTFRTPAGADLCAECEAAECTPEGECQCDDDGDCGGDSDDYDGPDGSY